MKKLDFSIGLLFITEITIILLFLDGNYAFYAFIIAVASVLPYIIRKMSTLFKENPEERKLIIINIIVILLILVIGYYCICDSDWNTENYLK